MHVRGENHVVCTPQSLSGYRHKTIPVHHIADSRLHPYTNRCPVAWHDVLPITCYHLRSINY